MDPIGKQFKSVTRDLRSRRRMVLVVTFSVLGTPNDAISSSLLLLFKPNAPPTNKGLFSGIEGGRKLRELSLQFLL